MLLLCCPQIPGSSVSRWSCRSLGAPLERLIVIIKHDSLWEHGTMQDCSFAWSVVVVLLCDRMHTSTSGLFCEAVYLRQAAACLRFARRDSAMGN